MKLASFRVACNSLRVFTSHSGNRFSGLSRRCLPVGVPNNWLPLRTVSATPSSGSSSTLPANFGKQCKQDNWSEYNYSVGEVVQRAKEAMATLLRRNPGIQPLLAILQAGEDDSILEINKKIAGKIGLNVTQICLANGCSEDEDVIIIFNNC